MLKPGRLFYLPDFSPQYGRGTLVYSTLLFLLVVGFTYFYTMVIFNQQNICESLQRNGGFIPGIRPDTPGPNSPNIHPVSYKDSLPDHPGRRFFLGWSRSCRS